MSARAVCSRPFAVAALTLALLGAACTTPPRSEPGPLLAPPAALAMNGVDPVPQSLVRAIGGYTDFRGARLVNWDAEGRGLLVAYLRDGRTQLHRLDAPRASMVPLTRANEPVRSGAYVPAFPNLLLYERDTGGDEVARLYRLDVTTGTETALTPPGTRYGLGPFNRAGNAVYATSVPVDRSADRSEDAAPTRRGGTFSTEILRLDPVSGTSTVVATLEGTGWGVWDANADESMLLLTRFRSVTDSELYILARGSTSPRRVLPKAGEAPAYYGRALFAADGSVLLVTDRAGEFRALERFDLASGRSETLTPNLPWDVERLDASLDRRTFAFVTNEGGRSLPHVFDATTGRVENVPAATGASVVTLQLSPDGRRLALTSTSSKEPAAIDVVDLATGTTTRWASSDTAGLDTGRFGETEVVTWPSFDGRRISGLITRPDPRRFPGKRPVLIQIHGGPESQARIGFQGRDNYLINELGITLIAPNVRGSAGFGKTFVDLDNGQRREDSVRDIGALLDWIGTQADLDPSRVAVYGGSYGGYMVHAVAVHYSARIRAAIAVVGISHFVSFLERTESYRRDLRRAEYGDERDPAMREFLARISPLTNAAQIKVPLFVIHGRNDPRVPVGEAEQIARTVTANGVPVWTMIAANEGHGFAKKENADYAFYARVLFLRRYLLGGA